MTAILVVGAAMTGLTLLNAFLSWLEEGWSWATKFRLAVTWFPIAATALALSLWNLLT